MIFRGYPNRWLWSASFLIVTVASVLMGFRGRCLMSEPWYRPFLLVRPSTTRPRTGSVGGRSSSPIEARTLGSCTRQHRMVGSGSQVDQASDGARPPLHSPPCLLGGMEVVRPVSLALPPGVAAQRPQRTSCVRPCECARGLFSPHEIDNRPGCPPDTGRRQLARA
jgi:hypothetical protein